MSHVIVIGAGQAGSSLVAKLRNDGFEGKITLIGSENVPPYQRPPLSKKYLLGEMELERLYLRPEAFYSENEIELRLGQTVTAVDVDAKTVSIGDETLRYTDLVFTTGSTPRRFPAAIGGDLENIFVVRSLADVDAMEQRFQPGKHLLIVGGGYIGLEAAAVAVSKGLKVTLIEMADRILQRVACPETSDFFRALHKQNGVDIREGIGLDTLLGNDHVSGAKLSNGETLNVDFVIAGIGIVPDVELAQAAGVAIENGIKTDPQGRTDVVNVWAAGDCASFPFRGERIRLESVPNAIDQAELVARNIMGAGEDYAAKPWFWSDQYDVKLQIAGLNTGYDNVITRDGGASKSFWYFKGEQLLAVDAANDPRAYMIGKRLIEAGRTADPEIIANSDADLKSLM